MPGKSKVAKLVNQEDAVGVPTPPQAVEAPKKAKGRPKGSKNRAKSEDASPALIKADELKTDEDLGVVYHEVKPPIVVNNAMIDINRVPTNNEDVAVAKQNHGQFYLKFYHGDLLDPFDSSIAPGRNIREHEFRAVNESAYRGYIKYLETQNPARFREVDRNCKVPY